MRRTMSWTILALPAFLLAASASAQTAPPAQEMAPPAVDKLTMMSAAVSAMDLERSLDFYVKGLGMISQGRVEQPNVTEAPVQFPGGGAYIILMHPKRSSTAPSPRTSLNRLIIAVPDLKALEARLKGAGYALKGPIREIAQYKVAVGMLEDPDGNHIELVQRSR
jgi:predicted enzyme related to lactoylglutathione lyase